MEALDPEEIVVYGVALDICSRYTIEGLLERRPDVQLHVVTDATKPIAVDAAEALLESWTRRGVGCLTAEAALRMPEAAAAGRDRTAT